MYYDKEIIATEIRGYGNRRTLQVGQTSHNLINIPKGVITSKSLERTLSLQFVIFLAIKIKSII